MSSPRSRPRSRWKSIHTSFTAVVLCMDALVCFILYSSVPATLSASNSVTGASSEKSCSTVPSLRRSPQSRAAAIRSQSVGQLKISTPACPLGIRGRPSAKRLAALLCAMAVARAAGVLAPAYGYGAYGNPYSAYPAQPALATQHQNIIRTPYNLGQISTFSKTVDTPFSSVSKSDVRVSNPGVAVSPYGLPAYRGLVAPAYHGLAAPAYHGLAAPGYASPLVSHVGVAPVAKVATAGLLGVAYSAAPTVSHMTYTNGLGLAYAW